MKLIDENDKRTDGRTLDELRPLKIKVGILKNADGSALIEQGKNKIIAAVYGPKEVRPKYQTLPDRALIKARYHMAPFSVSERKSPSMSRREIEISKVIREALEPAVLVEKFPRTEIDVFIEVLQADGGTRCASITAASVALADAGIPMRDLVTAVAVGKANGKIILDLNHLEDQYGELDLPIAMMPSLNQITLLQADGSMSAEEFNEALALGIKGINTIYKKQKEALKLKYKNLVKEYV